MITPFKLFIKNNFPFIENTYEALDNYGLLCKIVEKLNEVIESENKFTEDMNNLYAAFNNLKNYVDNYFEDLDVQEEIDNKLDELVEDGTLEDLIGQYVDNVVVPRINLLEHNINLEINTTENNLHNEITALGTEVNNSIEDLNHSLTSDIDYVRNQVQSVSSGAPAGVYTNVDGLTAANPDHTKIYVVVSDGYWYYWNNSNNSWTRGGVYQSSVNTDLVNNLNNNLSDLTVLNTIRNSQKINKGIDGITHLLVDRTGNNQITTNQIIYAENDIILNVDNSAYRFIVSYFTSTTWTTQNFISSTPWTSGQYTIPKGKYFAILFTKTDLSAFSSENDKFHLTVQDMIYTTEFKSLEDRVETLETKPTLYHIIGTGQSLAVRSRGKSSFNYSNTT